MSPFVLPKPASPDYVGPTAATAEAGREKRWRVLSVLHEERFVDLSPAEVYTTLLDEQTNLCSEWTMYRIFRENQEVK